MKKITKKLVSLVMVFTILLSYFTPIITVLAAASTNKLSVTFRNGENEEGKVQYSLNDGATWVDVTNNISNQDISVTGDNLKLRIVPNENKEVDFAGIWLSLDGVNAQNVNELGLDSNEGYNIPSNTSSVSLNDVEFRDIQVNPGQGNNPVQGSNTSSKITLRVSGSELEYNQPWSNDASDFVFGINGSQMRRLAKNEVNYIYENNEIIGLESKDEFDYEYNHEGDEPVTFNIRTQWNDVITSLRINGVSYNTPQTKEDLIDSFEGRGIEFEITNVPYSEEYEIEVEGRKQNENEIILGNFGWTYDPNTNEYSEDDKIPYGTLEFVKAVYNNHTYNTVDSVNAKGGVFEWKDASKTGDPFGEAMFPVGTELTVRLIPDKGYQLTELTLNGFPFTPGDEPGLYTFTIGGGNWHLGANFTEVDNEVDIEANNIRNGNINLSLENDDSFINGTAKLEVKDVENLPQNRKDEFINKAQTDGYEIDSYIDMSLYNTIYKGGKTDANGKIEAWDTKVDNIENDASITLQLNDDMSDKKIVLVHETHEGDTITGYEIIDTYYNEINNTITFRTDSFSDYAIAVRDSVKKDYTVEDSKGNSISFKEETGHTYTLDIIDWLTFNDEILESLGISREEFDEGINQIKNLTKDNGELLGFYQITVTDENDNEVHNGPLQIKIKMTDEMKKYNTFKLMYIDTDNGFTTEESITLTQDGDYLVGELPHLSSYALNGTYLSSNPQTGDNIMFYISMFGLSIIGLVGSGLYTRKRLFNK